MTVALWILTSFLVVVVTLVVVGASLRPYIADLIKESKMWQARAELAEAEIEAHISNEVRLVPIDPQDDLDVFLKGAPGLEGEI